MRIKIQKRQDEVGHLSHVLVLLSTYVSKVTTPISKSACQGAVSGVLVVAMSQFELTNRLVSTDSSVRH